MHAIILIDLLTEINTIYYFAIKLSKQKTFVVFELMQMWKFFHMKLTHTCESTIADYYVTFFIQAVMLWWLKCHHIQSLGVYFSNFPEAHASRPPRRSMLSVWLCTPEAPT